MGRSYAATLGLLAFAITMARGLVHASSPRATIAAAIGWLVAFAALGWVAGELAAWIVEDSIRSKLKTDGSGSTPANAAG